MPSMRRSGEGLADGRPRVWAAGASLREFASLTGRGPGRDQARLWPRTGPKGRALQLASQAPLLLGLGGWGPAASLEATGGDSSVTALQCCCQPCPRPQGRQTKEQRPETLAGLPWAAERGHSQDAGWGQAGRTLWQEGGRGPVVGDVGAEGDTRAVEGAWVTGQLERERHTHTLLPKCPHAGRYVGAALPGTGKTPSGQHQ